MSLDSITENMSNDVGAILWVHMAGLVTTDVLVAREICRKLNIYLIEDAAHAHGASVYDAHYNPLRMGKIPGNGRILINVKLNDLWKMAITGST